VFLGCVPFHAGAIFTLSLPEFFRTASPSSKLRVRFSSIKSDSGSAKNPFFRVQDPLFPQRDSFFLRAYRSFLSHQPGQTGGGRAVFKGHIGRRKPGHCDFQEDLPPRDGHGPAEKGISPDRRPFFFPPLLGPGSSQGSLHFCDGAQAWLGQHLILLRHDAILVRPIFPGDLSCVLRLSPHARSARRPSCHSASAAFANAAGRCLPAPHGHHFSLPFFSLGRAGFPRGALLILTLNGKVFSHHDSAVPFSFSPPSSASAGLPDRNPFLGDDDQLLPNSRCSGSPFFFPPTATATDVPSR